MKRIILLLIVLGMMDVAIPADAQQHHRKTTKHRRHYTYQKNTNYRFPKAQRNREREKTLDDRTTGTPTQGEVKLNEKGKYHNMNANTGTYVPPTSGENGK